MLFLVNSCKRHGHVLKMIQYGSWRVSPLWTSQCFAASSCKPCGAGAGGSGSKRQIKYKPYIEPCNLEHDQRNMALKRPMSPHLDVYAPTMPSLTSIFQRMTGVLLTFYALMLTGGALFLNNGIDTYVCMIQSLDLGRFSIFALKAIVGAPFAFHYFNGIRFCLWNAGRCLGLNEVYSTAKLSWLATVGLTVLFCLM